MAPMFGSNPLLASEAPTAEESVVVRIQISDPADGHALEEVIDVWSHGARSGTITALVSRQQLAELRASGYDVEVDLDQTATLPGSVARPHTLTPRAETAQRAGIPGFSCYRTVDETFRDMARLATDHPRLAEWFDIGDSWQKATGAGGGSDIMVNVFYKWDIITIKCNSSGSRCWRARWRISHCKRRPFN